MKDSLQKGEQINEYRLSERLWRGTFGETWAGETASGGKAVLQFFSDLLFLEEFKRAKIEAHPLTSPSIASLLAVRDDPPCLIWKYHNGRRLRTFAEKLRGIKLHVAVYIARKVLEALIFSSSRGKFHGALRATRVLITPEKRVVLTNFGVGFLEQRVLSQVAKQPFADRYMKILPYFPPEVLEDQLFGDAKSDIYAVGILMVEMLTGSILPPEKVPDAFAKLDMPEEHREDLIRITGKALAEFGERYNHPKQMYEELNNLLKGSKEVETIYVAPPQLNCSLEAIPADSEEYRVYQAELIAAKQSIDADVMPAEPVEPEIGFERTPAEGIPASALSVPGIHSQSVVLVPTIHSRILDRLDKEPVWPDLFLSYVTAASLWFIALAVVAFFTPVVGEVAADIARWPSLPFDALLEAPGLFAWLVAATSVFFFLSLFALPLLDPHGAAMKDHSAILGVTSWFAMFAFLGASALLSGEAREVGFYASAAVGCAGWLFLSCSLFGFVSARIKSARERNGRPKP